MVDADRVLALVARHLPRDHRQGQATLPPSSWDQPADTGTDPWQNTTGSVIGGLSYATCGVAECLDDVQGRSPSW